MKRKEFKLTRRGSKMGTWAMRWPLYAKRIQDTTAIGATVARGFREGA